MSLIDGFHHADFEKNSDRVVVLLFGKGWDIRDCRVLGADLKTQPFARLIPSG